MKKKKDPRDCVLVIKVTASEKKKITDFAARHSVNISALIRKLLFDRLENENK